MKPILVSIYIFLGAVFFAIPNMTRRGILFAVRVPTDFRQSSAGRRSINLFRSLMAATVVVVLAAILLSPLHLIGLVTLAAPFILILIAGLGFFWQHRQLGPFAVQSRPPREVVVSTLPDRLPWFTWLSVGPFAILATCAIFLQSNWANIPVRFPVHWGADGQPNRWSERSIHGVYGPLLFGAELCLWFVASALLSWFGARRSRLRTAMLGCLIAVEYMLGLLFGIIAISPLIHIPILITVLGPMVILIPMIIVMARVASEPGDPVEPTPEECWKGGVLYYNPNDSALVVEKRLGTGYTFNFANHLSWALLGSMVLIVLSAFLLF